MKTSRLLAALMLAAALTLAACGDDDDDDGGGGEKAAAAAALSILTTDNSVEVSGDMAPGVTEVTLRNDGKKPASGQLLRIEGDHPEKEVVKAFNRVSQGGAIPDWILAGGGVSTTAPGEAGEVTQELEEGQYYAINDQADKVGKGQYAVFEVSGDAVDAELPEGSTVTASEYKFEADGIAAGDPIVLQNVGDQPHHLVALPMKPGATIEEANRFLRTEKGPPVVDFEAGADTAVIDRDQTLVTDLGLKPGKYAFICFISDRQGGRSHFDKGMISEATVE